MPPENTNKVDIKNESLRRKAKTFNLLSYIFLLIVILAFSFYFFLATFLIAILVVLFTGHWFFADIASRLGFMAPALFSIVLLTVLFVVSRKKIQQNFLIIPVIFFLFDIGAIILIFSLLLN